MSGRVRVIRPVPTRDFRTTVPPAPARLRVRSWPVKALEFLCGVSGWATDDHDYVGEINSQLRDT